MNKKDIPAIIPIVLAFIMIFAALTCAFIAIGNDSGFFRKDDGQTEAPVTTANGMPTVTPTLPATFDSI